MDAGRAKRAALDRAGSQDPRAHLQEPPSATMGPYSPSASSQSSMSSVGISTETGPSILRRISSQAPRAPSHGSPDDPIQLRDELHPSGAAATGLNQGLQPAGGDHAGAHVLGVRVDKCCSDGPPLGHHICCRHICSRFVSNSLCPKNVTLRSDSAHVMLWQQASGHAVCCHSAGII